MHVGKLPMTRPRLCAMNWQMNWPTSIQAFAQKLVELLARVVVNDREIEYINKALAKWCRPPACCRTQGTRPALGREQRRDAAHHRSVELAALAAALELSVATEKIVETPKGFRAQMKTNLEGHGPNERVDGSNTTCRHRVNRSVH